MKNKLLRYIAITALAFLGLDPLFSTANETNKLEFIPNKNIFLLSCKTNQIQFDKPGNVSYEIKAELGVLVFIELKDIEFRNNLSAKVIYETADYVSAIRYSKDTIIGAFYFDDQTKFRQRLDIYSKKATNFRMRVAYVRPNAQLSKNLSRIQWRLASDFQDKLIADVSNGVSSASLEQDPPVNMDALCSKQNSTK